MDFLSNHWISFPSVLSFLPESMDFLLRSIQILSNINGLPFKIFPKSLQIAPRFWWFQMDYLLELPYSNDFKRKCIDFKKKFLDFKRECIDLKQISLHFKRKCFKRKCIDLKQNSLDVERKCIDLKQNSLDFKRNCIDFKRKSFGRLYNSFWSCQILLI